MLSATWIVLLLLVFLCGFSQHLVQAIMCPTSVVASGFRFQCTVSEAMCASLQNKLWASSNGVGYCYLADSLGDGTCQPCGTDQPSGCQSYTSCSSCTSAPSCGWANGVSCYPGTYAAASPPYSSSSSWIWGSSGCRSATPAPTSSNLDCFEYTTCRSCTSTGSCGWADGNSCFPGTASGASYPYWSSSSWIWGSASCGNDPESTNTIPPPGVYCSNEEAALVVIGNSSYFSPAGLASCQKEGALSVAASGVTFTPLTSSCSSNVSVNAVSWSNGEVSILGMTGGSTSSWFVLSTSRCIESASIPSGWYVFSTQTWNGTVLVAKKQFSFNRMNLNPCIVAGNYSVDAGSNNVTLSTTRSSCTNLALKFLSFQNTGSGTYLTITASNGQTPITITTRPVQGTAQDLPATSDSHSKQLDFLVYLIPSVVGGVVVMLIAIGVVLFVRSRSALQPISSFRKMDAEEMRSALPHSPTLYRLLEDSIEEDGAEMV